MSKWTGSIEKLQWSDNICTVGHTNFWAIVDVEGMEWIFEMLPMVRISPTFPWRDDKYVYSSISDPMSFRHWCHITGHDKGGFYFDHKLDDRMHAVLHLLFPVEWRDKYWIPKI